MENDKEGNTSQTATAVDFGFAARGENNMPTSPGGNHMPKIPDTVDEIEVLAVKHNLVELRRDVWLN
jgi:hypothetical protein